jgi:DNA repair protein RadC
MILILDAKNHVRGYKVVPTGRAGQDRCRPPHAVQDALLLGAAAIILAHNHPSGDPTPSGHDLALTRQLSMGGEVLRVKVPTTLSSEAPAGSRPWRNGGK